MGAGDNVICQVFNVLQEVSSFRAKPTSVSQPIELLDDDVNDADCPGLLKRCAKKGVISVNTKVAAESACL